VYIPQRGDIVWMDFDPQAGREQQKRRPAIVISPRSFNEKTRLAVVCPITSKAKGYFFEIPLIAAMSTAGVVLVDQFKSLDWSARKIEFIEKAPSKLIDDVMEKIEAILF
jgi:mRNA interferase MazF